MDIDMVNFDNSKPPWLYQFNHINHYEINMKWNINIMPVTPDWPCKKVGKKVIASITDLLDVHFNVEKCQSLESC